MLVQHGFGDPGGVGDLLHRRAVKAVGGEAVEGHLEQLAAPAGGGQPLA